MTAIYTAIVTFEVPAKAATTLNIVMRGRRTWTFFNAKDCHDFTERMCAAGHKVTNDVSFVVSPSEAEAEAEAEVIELRYSMMPKVAA